MKTATRKATAKAEPMSTYDACAAIEGWDGDHTREEVVTAMQTLIDSGEAWHLQGFYGRLAHQLIKAGLCRAA